MNKPLLQIYTYVDGVKDTPFPNATNPVEISEYTFTDKTMGSATLSATFMYPTCLDDLWETGKQYVDFRGERYFIVKTPSSSEGNDDVRFKHDIEFMPGRAILDNIYFYDVVGSGTDYNRYISNSPNVLFYGDIHEFANRLNSSLTFSNVPYKVFVNAGITSEVKEVNLENVFISNALQEIFNIFELPYYFDGTDIHIGYTTNAITHTFRYGRDYELLSASKTNANYKITNRVTGTGGTENIQFYYPNEKNNRTEVEAGGGQWITPSTKLMPPIYRSSNGAERFYNAKNNTYISPQTGDYYVFENEYTHSNPREQIVDFPDIYPTLKGAVDSYGNRIDVLDAVAFDENDNDNIDAETGEYVHPYFYIKLRQFSGNFGFNLFDQAIVGSDATVVMTSGNCAPCVFEIGVVETTEDGRQVFKNPVQVDKDGNILQGDYKEKVNVNNFIASQQDTSLNSVWIAVKKDISTYGVVMPNKEGGIKPQAGDSFVFTNINMPEGYVLRAEDKLKEAIIKYMANNNSEKFTFSIKLSRIFLAENPKIADLINSRARIDLEYNGKYHQLYISSYTYKADSEILPEITVELADTLTISKNSLQTAIDSVKLDIMSSVGSIDFLKQGLKYFIRKDVPDTSRYYITFMQGLKVGNYKPGANSGGIFTVDENDKTTIETDFLKVRMKAYFETLEIVNVTSIGGKMIITPGGAIKCIKVVDREDIFDKDGNKTGENIWNFYRCYFLAEQDGVKIENKYAVGDLAYSQSFNISAGSSSGVSNHYYWREVVGTGGDYVDLSKANADTGSDIPREGDIINQLGNKTDVTRQNALIFSSVDLYSPSITFYQGIDNFSYTDKDFISYGVEKIVETDELGNQIVTNKAFYRIFGDAYIGGRDFVEYMQYKDGKFKIKGQLEVGTTIGDGSTIEDALEKMKKDAITASEKSLSEYASIVTKDIDEIQKQIDGVVESYFYDYDPNDKNVPAINWTTEAMKQAHANDTFTNLSTGNSWKWVKDGTTWKWAVITDTATLKALALAGKAQDTADSKRKVFVAQPKDLDSYEVGDLWVNATYGSIYKDDLLRCVTAKVAGVLFDISHWTLATKYTDDTLAEEARRKALKAAEAASDAATAAAVVAGSVETLNKYVDGAFKDGIITEAEKKTIKSYLNSVNSTKKGIEATYTKLYENNYLTGTAKTGLKTAYDSLVSAINDLIDKINKAIAVDATDADIAAVDTAFTTFNNAIGTFNTAVETANKAIQDKLKTFSDAAQAAADAAQAAATNAKNAADAASTSVTNLTEYVDGAFKDGIVTATESQAISTYINTVNNAKTAIKATYDKLYANAYLAGDAKTGLLNAYNTINTAITALIKSIEDAIADGVTTKEESADVNAKYAAFNTANGTFNTAVETANKAIQDKLKGYSDTAQAAADAAKGVADAAKARLDNWAADGTISPTEKQGIKDEIKRIDADKTQVEEGYTLYSLGTPTAFNEAHKTYRDQLVALSAASPENIAIPATFAANQTAYYTKRSEALATIAQAGKSVADNAQAAADAAKQRLDNWAADGVISPTEKQGLKDELARIESDKNQITAGYTLYALGTPTSFNSAYTSYKDQLTKLSATTPEVITIPANFATIQTTYYTERTAAINAINSASKKAIETVQANVDKTLAEVNKVKSEVAGLREFTDDAFADGVLTATEYNTIKGYLKNIDTTQQDVNNSYAKVYDNPLLDGTYKTDLSSAKSSFDAAINELRAAINALTPTISSSDRADFDAKYTNFNTKYGSFIAALNAANRYIQEKLNSKIDNAIIELTAYKPIKDALLEKTTTTGGLILSSTISLGYTDATSGSYITKSGITGIYDNTAIGGGIAAWYGGSPKDRDAYTASTMPSDVAKSVIRMDGTGYFAGGNFTWDSQGHITCRADSFLIRESDVGNYLLAFQVVMNNSKVDYIKPQAPFQSLNISTSLQIGGGKLSWDAKNKAFYVEASDGSVAGFYATGFVSARGISPSSTITPPLINTLGDIKDVTLTSLKEDDILVRRGSAWVNVPASTIGGGGGSVDGIILNGTTYSPDSSTKLITLPNYPTVPSSLKNPYAITFTGYQSKTYDGSSAVSVAIPTSLPASDVYAWAKASSKPAYTWTEISSKPAWIGASKPSYAYSEISGTPASLKNPYALTLQRHGTSLGSYDGSAAKTFNIAAPTWAEVTGKPSWIGSTKPSYAFSEITSKPTTLSGYGITDAPTKTGSGASGTWGISITGNAASAAKWTTARTFRLTDANVYYNGLAQNVDGSSNVTLRMPSIIYADSITAGDKHFNEYLASYNSLTTTITGTICITLPNSWNSSMNIYEIYIYEYSDINASVITIGGYNYNSSSPSWINTAYHTRGTYNKGVRLGYNGSRCVIMLGSTTTTWSYPQIFLKSVLSGFSNYDKWVSGYSISILTSESGYSHIVSPGVSAEYLGDVHSPKFIKDGSSDSYVLLGGGGHKSLSSFTSEADAKYVTSIGTSGNYLTWAKNGATNNITIPYATAAGYLESTGNAGITNTPLIGSIGYTYGISSSLAGSLPNVNNANGVLTINTHKDNYFHQLGFSSNGNLYHRTFNSSAPNTSNTWVQLLTSSNYYSTTDGRYYTKAQTDSSYVKSLRSSTDLVYYYRNGSESPVNIYVSNAPKWTNARTITLTGAVTGSVSIDGSANVSLNTTYALGSLDSRYYTESEADSRFVNATGDTMTGNLHFNLNSYIYFNDSTAFRVGSNGTDGTYLCYNGNKLRATSGQPYYNNYIMWCSGNDGAGSGLDADLLDGVQYQNILERSYSGSNGQRAEAAWYRVGRFLLSNAMSPQAIIMINRSYNSPSNEGYTFSISLGYNGDITFSQLSGNTGGHIITQVRIDYTNSGNAYFDIYCGYSGYINSIYVTSIGAFETYTGNNWIVNPTVAGAAAVYATYSGMYCNRGITANLSGIASYANQLSTSRNIWGQPFNGTGNVTGEMRNVGTILSADNSSYYIGSASNQWAGVFTGYVCGGSGSDLILGSNNNLKVWLKTSGNIGINTSSPTYMLHVAGDIYSAGYIRSVSGFYMQSANIYYANVNGYASISSAGNEICIDGRNDSGIHVNYRKGVTGYAPKTWYWNAGSSSSWADFNIGGVSANGNISATGSMSAGSSISANGSVNANAGYLTSTYNGKTIKIGSQNANRCHYETTANAHWFNKEIQVQGNIMPFDGGRTLGSKGTPFSTIYTTNWFRSTGKTGWYNEDYAGGIYMTDSTYVRVYNNKYFYVSATAITNFSTANALSTSGGFFAEKGITTNGYVYAKGAITARQTSDRRMKTDFDTRVDYRDRLLMLGNVVDFSYNEFAIKRGKGAVDSLRHTSVIYQNALRANITGMCIEEDDGYGCINPISPDLIFTIVGAVQANILSIRSIESRTERMERELLEAKEEIRRLRKLLPV